MSRKKMRKIEKNKLPEYPEYYDKQSIYINIKNIEYKFVRAVAKALSSPVRLKILQLLAGRDCSIGGITAELGLSQSNTTQQVARLEAAGLISCRREPGIQGRRKICRLSAYNVLLNLVPPETLAGSEPFVEESMPVGLCTDVRIQGPCGLAGEDGLLGQLDDPGVFFRPQRSAAQLLWFTRGWIEYRFPLPVGRVPRDEGHGGFPAPEELERIEAIEFRAELCSEFPGYNEDWPSDITLWFNGVELGTWTSPGDMGGRRGSLTPHWWEDHATQYGLLTIWRIDSQGTQVNGRPIENAPSLTDLDLTLHTGLAVRLGIKTDSPNQGGLNLFGGKFGDYAQDPALRFYFYSVSNRVDSPGKRA